MNSCLEHWWWLIWSSLSVNVNDHLQLSFNNHLTFHWCPGVCDAFYEPSTGWVECDRVCSQLAVLINCASHVAITGYVFCISVLFCLLSSVNLFSSLYLLDMFSCPPHWQITHIMLLCVCWKDLPVHRWMASNRAEVGKIVFSISLILWRGTVDWWSLELPV